MIGMEWRKIIYNDFGRPTPKTGYMEREDANFVYIRNERGSTEAIAKTSIIRMEIRLEPSGDGENGR
jgi:hypothetical protein